MADWVTVQQMRDALERIALTEVWLDNDKARVAYFQGLARDGQAFRYERKPGPK